MADMTTPVSKEDMEYLDEYQKNLTDKELDEFQTNLTVNETISNLEQFRVRNVLLSILFLIQL